MLLFVLSLAFAGDRSHDEVTVSVPDLLEESVRAEAALGLLVDQARDEQHHYLATCRDTKHLAAKALLEVARTAAINHRHLAEGPDRDAEARRVRVAHDQIALLREQADTCAPPPPRPWMPADEDDDIRGDREEMFEPWQPTGRVTDLIVPSRS